ncbi:hypothetical protein EC968_000530 [Mortierella alpina]|nr:hypothetical protein EC968_000530 [Mortierella alpina]
MKIASITALLAVATAVVAAPAHSRRSLVDTKQVLARRQIPNGSASDAQVVSDLITKQDDSPSPGSVICQLLQEEPLKSVVQTTTALWEELQNDPDIAPGIENLGDVFKTIAGDLSIAGKRTLAKVKKALTKTGGTLGEAVVAEIDDAVKKFESALPMIMFEVAACVAELQEEQTK